MMSSDSRDEFAEFNDLLVKEFLKRRRREVSESAVNCNKTALRQYLPHLDGTPVDEATYTQVVEFADTLVDRGCTEGTVRNYMSTISSLHNYLNDFHRVGMPDVSRIPNRYSNFESIADRKPIDRDEIRKLIDATESLQEALVISLIYFAGLRASDAADLKLREVKDGEYFDLVDAVKDGDRTLPVHTQIQRLFQIWINEERPSYPHASSDYLFVGKRSEKLDKFKIWNIVHKAAHEADIQRVVDERVNGDSVYRVKTHVLRHSFATHAFQDGMSLEEIAAFMGHEDTKTTRKYIHKFAEEEASKSYRDNFDPL